MILYNLFPLLAGKFSHWKSHIDRAADMGFDWIFVNPIQKPGFSGSLYSTADYFQLHPLLVDSESKQSPEAQLKEITKAAEQKGLKMMVDLVINHCAVDSKLTQEHPKWFVHEADGSLAHPYCYEDGHKITWGDLVSFDHEHTADPEGLYRYFYKIVEYLVELGFKGFRCDAAYQIPKSLWQRLISETKKHYPDTLFAAETLGCKPAETRETALAGFDYIFNSSKWWDFHSPWLLLQYASVREIAPSISFPESHDTERLFQEMNGSEGAMKQRYLFASVFSSGVMMPIGYEFGFRRKLHVVETRPENWEHPNIDLRDFIRKVNDIKKHYKLFQDDGPLCLLPSSNPSILFFWKTSMKSSEEALIILNKDPWNTQHFHADDLKGFIQSGAALKDVSPEHPVADVATPFSYDLNPGQGLILVAGG